MKYNMNITVKPSNLIFVGTLTVLFVVLKVLGYINWSWVWVFAPLWIDLILVIVMTMIMLIAYTIVTKKRDK